MFASIPWNRINSSKIIGARGFPLRLILSLGAMGGGLARIQNCSGGGGVRDKYLKNSKKVQRQKPRHWALENRLGAGKHVILLGISPRFFLVSACFRKTHQKPTNNSPKTRQKLTKTHQKLSKTHPKPLKTGLKEGSGVWLLPHKVWAHRDCVASQG